MIEWLFGELRLSLVIVALLLAWALSGLLRRVRAALAVRRLGRERQRRERLNRNIRQAHDQARLAEADGDAATSAYFRIRLHELQSGR